MERDSLMGEIENNQRMLIIKVIPIERESALRAVHGGIDLVRKGFPGLIS